MPLGPFLILAILVLTPLGLAHVRDRDRGSARSTVRMSGPLYAASAALACVAVLLDPGALAGALALPWLAFALIEAIHGLRRLLTADRGSLADACMDVGLGYLAVGAAWLALWRLGSPVMDLDPRTVGLTAIHFHYAGFVAVTIAGLVGRALPAGPGLVHLVYRFAAAGIAIGPAPVALGIAAVPALEAIAALLLATAVAVLGVLILVALVPRSSGGTRALLVISASSAVFAMLLVAAHSITGALGRPVVSSEDMARWHGTANALGFSFAGLMAWTIRPVGDARRSIPFSALRSGWRVGPDFFERTGSAREGIGGPRGLVQSLDDLASSDFDPTVVDPGIRSFYEDTEGFDLRLFPRWRRGLGPIGALYARLSSGIEQVHYDVTGGRTEDRVRSRIVALDPAVDGRQGVRGWVRTYERTGRSIYVAAYATHRDPHRGYMNIAFPLPGGNLASILRVAHLEDGGLVLTSVRHPDAPGDEGVYFANRVHPIRLPIDERIRVWSRLAEGVPGELRDRATVSTMAFARHDVWILGVRALTLDYAIDEVSGARAAAPTCPGAPSPSPASPPPAPRRIGSG
jgi:hypothetical protein